MTAGSPSPSSGSAGSRDIVFVELLGFPPSQVELFATTLGAAPDAPFVYRVMSGASEIADAFIVNADSVRAMVALQLRCPDNARPAILIGHHAWDTAWPLIDPSWVWSELFRTLNRSMTLAFDLRHTFSDHRPKRDRWPYVDRRRRGRLDLDLTEPDIYAAMRRGAALPA